MQHVDYLIKALFILSCLALCIMMIYDIYKGIK